MAFFGGGAGGEFVASLAGNDFAAGGIGVFAEFAFVPVAGIRAGGFEDLMRGDPVATGEESQEGGDFQALGLFGVGLALGGRGVEFELDRRGVQSLRFKV